MEAIVFFFIITYFLSNQLPKAETMSDSFTIFLLGLYIHPLRKFF